MNLWKKVTDLTITKVLRFAKDATMTVTNTDNSISTVSLTELGVLDVTAGTATASKAVVLGSSKEIATITSATITTLTSTSVNATNVDAGASGTAGTVDVFPTTASKGKLQLTCADQTGNTTVTVTTAAMAAARTLTIPDPGAAASFVMTEGAQTLNGVKTFGGGIAFGASATLDVDSAAVSATGNDTTQSATVTKMAGTITTGALTTAANADTAVVLTLTGVAAGDIILVTLAGGTNTTSVVVKSAIATTDTITVVLRNDVLITTALNGTVKFHYLWMKA
jgi:hypothetical protein